MSTTENGIHLGNKLQEIHASKSIIFGAIIRRIVFAIGFVIVFTLIGYGAASVEIGNKTFEMVRMLVVVPCCILFSLYPLIHIKDNLQFYEYGICYKKHCWTFQELQPISWHHSYHSLFGNDLTMCTRKKNIDVFYFKDVVKIYNQTYMKQV